LAKVISHPWFNAIFSCPIILMALCGGVYLWRERVQAKKVKEASNIKNTLMDAGIEDLGEHLQEAAVVKETAAKLVSVMDDEKIAVTGGEQTVVGKLLSSAMDEAHKTVVRKLRFDAAAKKASKS